MEYLASIDAGKYHTCCVSEEKEMMFLTRLREIPEYDPDLEKIIELNGKLYSLGEDDGKVDTSTSKLTLTHKLCTLYGITELFPQMPSKQEIYLVTTCPYTHFNNASIKAEYKEYYVGNYVIKVNNTTYKFTIKDVLVMPESAGVVYSNIKTFKNKLVGVIDWGGLQVNGMIYDDRKMVKTSGFTKQFGGYSLETDIIKGLNSDDKEANYQPYEIKYILDDEEENISKIVSGLVNDQINKIISECHKSNWNFKRLKLVWTGGSSLRFKSFLNDLGYTVSENAIMDNSRGNLEVAKAWLKRVNQQ